MDSRRKLPIFFLILLTLFLSACGTPKDTGIISVGEDNIVNILDGIYEGDSGDSEELENTPIQSQGTSIQSHNTLRGLNELTKLLEELGEVSSQDNISYSFTISGDQSSLNSNSTISDLIHFYNRLSITDAEWQSETTPISNKTYSLSVNKSANLIKEEFKSNSDNVLINYKILDEDMVTYVTNLSYLLDLQFNSTLDFMTIDSMKSILIDSGLQYIKYAKLLLEIPTSSSLANGLPVILELISNLNNQSNISRSVDHSNSIDTYKLHDRSTNDALEIIKDTENQKYIINVNLNSNISINLTLSTIPTSITLPDSNLIYTLQPIQDQLDTIQAGLILNPDIFIEYEYLYKPSDISFADLKSGL